MTLSKRTWIAATISVATALASLGPVQAAPFARTSGFSLPDMTQQVDWRGRRNGALVAGAIGLGVLGIAAAAAASERSYERRVYAPYGGYDQDYGYAPAYQRPDYGYGYQQPSYAYEPAPVYRQRYVYEEAPVYHARPRYRQSQRQNYHDYGRGLERSRDPAGNN